MKNYKILIVSGSDIRKKENGGTKVLLDYLRYKPNNYKIDIINLYELINIKRSIYTKLNPFISITYNRKSRTIKIQDYLQQKIKDNKYDLIYYHGSLAMINVIENDIKKIGNFIDLFSKSWEYYYKSEKNFLKKIFCIKEKKICEYFEKNFVKIFDKIIVVNNNEARIANLKYSTQNVISIPIGIEIKKEMYKVKEIEEKINLIYIGNMSFKTNREGILHFYNHYFKFLPKNYWLHIVGPESEKIELIDRRVKKYGFIKNLDEIMKNMDFGIATMINGGGQKNKILDYLSYGLPTFINSFTYRSNYFDSEYIYKVDDSNELLEKVKKMIIIDREKVKNSISKYSANNSAKIFWKLVEDTIESRD